MKRFKFKVKPKHKDGALGFPTDMLRYDRCYPTTSEDARAIDNCCGMIPLIDYNKFAYPSEVIEIKPFKGTIELQSNDRKPSSEAWESHGWLVCSCESFRQ